jgi:hypothetical protein
MFEYALKTAVAACLVAATCTPAKAAYTMRLYESGGNVLASGSGSINLDGVILSGDATTANLIRPTSGLLYVGGPTSHLVRFSVSGPANFGGGVTSNSTSSTGSYVGIAGVTQVIYVPNTYASGTSFTTNATWNATTLAGLGATPGTYTWTWGSGANADSYTLIIGSPTPPAAIADTASVPTLSEWGLLILASSVGLLAFYQKRRQRATQTRP